MESMKELYSDRPGASILNMINPVIAVVLLVLGILGSDPLPVFLALGMGIFIWFTRHVRYQIFSDRLVIQYGKPRLKAVLLSDIAEVHSVLGGKGLFIKSNRAGGLLIRPRDPETFQMRLEDARRESIR